MLNHTYTSVKNANLVDCGKKQHIPSQPSALLRDNFLGEFRTELDKKKVLANLGIATSLSLEWEFIKGDIGRSEALMNELDSRTKYVSAIDGFQKSLIDGIKYLESVVGGEQEGEEEQNQRLSDLETLTDELVVDLEEVKEYLTDTIEVDIDKLEEDLGTITEKVNNITDLIQVSSKAGNALRLVSEDELEEGETPGLYVPDLSDEVSTITDNVTILQTNVKNILDTYVTKEQLGGEGEDGFNFVDEGTYNSFVNSTSESLSNIRKELSNTVKTGEDGHVDTLYVNKISKNNDDGNIKITDSFEPESGIPLDIRAVVENLEELLALPVKVCYPGMGVIVNSLSSLYILRKPNEEIKLTQEYVSNIYNWKCPEDLVTVALSREEYEKLAEVNPNVFYYIYEDEFKLTHKPREDEYGNLDDYQNALKDWEEQMKVLDQQYLAASWGLEIEDKLGKKANQTSVNALSNSINDLQEQINLIAGGNSDTSLSNLAGRLSETEASLEFLLGTDGTAEEPSTEGKISEIENSISELNTTIVEDYVSIDSITTENGNTNYIFVKKSEYESDKLSHDQALAKNVTTDNVNTSNINLSNLTVTSDGTDLLINEKEVALLEEVPVIIYLTQKEYDLLVESGKVDPNAYYYTTNEEIYVTKTEFDTKVTQLNTSIKSLNGTSTNNNSSIASMQNQIQTLLETIETLKGRIAALEESAKTSTN
jgi:flavodoxin